LRLNRPRYGKDKALPFEPLVPNSDTIEAMKAARRGDLVTVDPSDNLLASLDAGDWVQRTRNLIRAFLSTLFAFLHRLR